MRRRHTLVLMLLLAGCNRTHSVDADDIDGIADGGAAGSDAGGSAGEGSGAGSSNGSGSSGGGGSSSGGGWTGGTGGWDSGDGCSTGFSPVHPAMGATDVYYRSVIEVDVWSADGSETVTLADADGVPVSGTVTDTGWSLVMTPDAPLLPDTNYTVAFGYCDGQEAIWTFRTSSVGSPVSGCDPAATHFALDFDAARVTQPAGVGELLLGLLDGEALLSLGQLDASPRLVLGYGDGSDVETCAPTEAVPITWTDPRFEGAAASLPLRGLDASFNATNVEIAGDISPDCAELAGVSFTGVLDVREMSEQAAELLGISDPDEICATMLGFGVTCTTCTDGPSYCLDFAISDITATARGSSQSPITAEEVLALGECTQLAGGCSVTPARRALGVVATGLLALGLVIRRRRIA
jgi:hypothetical protein